MIPFQREWRGIIFFMAKISYAQGNFVMQYK